MKITKPRATDETEIKTISDEDPRVAELLQTVADAVIVAQEEELG